MTSDDQEYTPLWKKPKVSFSQKLIPLLIHIFGWAGMATLYYIAFSFFFDTPLEYEMKLATQQLKTEYGRLNQRYDTVERVLQNVIERDRSVFRTLFESDPYSFDDGFDKSQWEAHEKLLTKTNKELGDLFLTRLNAFDRATGKQTAILSQLDEKMDSLKTKLSFIPGIQPIVNQDLTLLTASYGMRIHPFYKTLTAHQGVDYTVSEGTRVFATADGWVSDVITRQTSSGNTVAIDHGNGYETSYSHLSKIYVKRGEFVRRGDIIAQSGNTGLSLAPHLHYEVKHKGIRVDPIHYFFLELNYKEYQKITRIAQSGMQSFD